MRTLLIVLSLGWLSACTADLPTESTPLSTPAPPVCPLGFRDTTINYGFEALQECVAIASQHEPSRSTRER